MSRSRKRMIEIKAIKPAIWNFEIVKGEKAWEEVVYSGRVSGVPASVKDKDVFRMIVENNYSSALEHVIVKFDIKITRGNAPEFLEHRMISHTGYSTRYHKVSEGIDRKGHVFEIILPTHLLRETEVKNLLLSHVKSAVRTYERLLAQGVPKEIARYSLPFAQAVGIYHVTINLRSLLNLLSLRLCVRASPEFRCIAAQLYFALVESLPIVRGLVGCRGFMEGACPESGVTGVRKGEQHPLYPSCPFKDPGSSIYIPTEAEVRKGVETPKFNLTEAIETQEKGFRRWADWE